MKWIVSNMTISLGITIAAELAVAWVMKVREKSDICLVILVNIITNPVLMYCFIVGSIFLERRVLWGIIAVLELGVFALEAVLYRRYLKAGISPWKLSACANITSFTAGIIIKYAVL